MAVAKSNRFMTIPNLISLLRLFLIIPAAYYLWHDNLITLTILIIVGVASDYLDGILARRLNQISELGKILDPLADKLSIGVCMMILYLKNDLPFWLLLIVIVRDVAILLAGLFYIKKYKIVIPSNMIGKITVNVLSATVIAYIYHLETIAQIFTPLAVLFVIISSYSYLIRFINEFKQNNIRSA